jgi:hypothetical protein
MIALGQLAIDTGARPTPLVHSPSAALAFEAGLRPIVPGCRRPSRRSPERTTPRRRACSAAATFAKILGAVPFAPDRARRERTLAAAREALDAEAFAVAYGRGRAMGWRRQWSSRSA